MSAHRFTATIESGGEGDGTTAFVAVPPEIVAALGQGKRPRVVVTLNGHSYRSTVAVYGGTFMLPVRREVREAAGVQHRVPIEVSVALDEAPREVILPNDFAALLAAAPDARAAFDALSFSHRKEYVEWIEDAKRPETRQRRLARAIEMLREGVKTPR